MGAPENMETLVTYLDSFYFHLAPNFAKTIAIQAIAFNYCILEYHKVMSNNYMSDTLSIKATFYNEGKKDVCFWVIILGSRT